MRQLLIWAVQRAARSTGAETLSPGMVEALVQALFANQINTSWYQRPLSLSLETNASAPSTTRPGPKSQELLDCIEIYEKYQAKLRTELAEWQAVSQRPPLSLPTLPTPDSPMVLTHPHGVELQALGDWMTHLPQSIDQLQWTLAVASAFEQHAHAYCEGVFHQIRAKFFNGPGTTDGTNMPMLLMKALGSQ